MGKAEVIFEKLAEESNRFSRIAQEALVGGLGAVGGTALLGLGIGSLNPTKGRVVLPTNFRQPTKLLATGLVGAALTPILNRFMIRRPESSRSKELAIDAGMGLMGAGSMLSGASMAGNPKVKSYKPGVIASVLGLGALSALVGQHSRYMEKKRNG